MDHLAMGLAHLNEINAQLIVFWPEQQHLVKLRLNEITAILVSAAQEAANMPIINSKPDYGSIGDYVPVGPGPSPAGVTIASISRNGATTAARTYKTFDDPRSMHFVPSPGEKQRIYARREAIAFQDREELQRRQVAQSIASRERERILGEEGNALFMNRSRLELERLENAAAAERQAIVARVQEAVTKTEAKEENRENPLEQHLTPLLQRVKEQNARTDAAAERQANIARAKEAVSKREALEHQKSVAQPEQTLPERIAQQPQPTAPSGPGSVESPSSGSSSQTPTWAQTPIEKDQDVAATRPLTNAETLAKKHEEEERSHQLSIPTRSASGSWAGVAAEGVSKVVNKAINMHSITASPLTEPSRTLTTLGRFRSKTRTASGIPIDSPQQIKDLAAEVFPGPYEFRLEASADAQRSVCITNPPPTMTVQEISDAIHEGALTNADNQDLADSLTLSSVLEVPTNRATLLCTRWTNPPSPAVVLRSRRKLYSSRGSNKTSNDSSTNTFLRT